jgi:tripartite ATP-independent transporter DctP family solute receptor
MLIGAASAGQVEIIVAHGQTVTEPTQLAWLLFKEEVEKNSNGEMKVEVYPNGQMGEDRETTEGVQMGTFSLTSPSSPLVAPFVNALYVLDTFFLFDDAEHVYRVLDHEGLTMLDEAAKDKDFRIVAFWDNGFRYITNNIRPIRSPADMVGMKLRVMENPLHVAAWKAIGCNPTPMAYGEVFTALQQGTIDGQENPMILLHTARFYEIQKYITKSGHLYAARPILMNREQYESFTPKQKEIFDNAMKAATKLEREEFKKQNEDREQIIRKANVNEFIELTPEEKAAFREKLLTVVPLIREKAGDEFTDKFMKIVESTRQK